MAISPQWKVYTADGEYIAACKYIQDAAALIATRGHMGDSIRFGHRKVCWEEGVDGTAAQSYDFVVQVCQTRLLTR